MNYTLFLALLIFGGCGNRQAKTTNNEIVSEQDSILFCTNSTLKQRNLKLTKFIGNPSVKRHLEKQIHF